MKKILLMFLILVLCSPVFGEAIEKASEAHQRGDFTTAVKIYRDLAEQGNAEAQHWLGDFYASGKGLTKDVKKALYWLHKSAEQGYQRAWGYLTFIYIDVKDYEEAFKCLKKEAEQTDYTAHRIADYLEDKETPHAFKEKCLALMENVAEEGRARFQEDLGRLYGKGIFVKKDYKVAMKWSLKAAEQGNPSAQWHIYSMYYRGEGVPRNYVLAYMWGSLAASDESYSWLARSVNKMEKKMTRSQIEEAQRMAREKYAEIEAKIAGGL